MRRLDPFVPRDDAGHFVNWSDTVRSKPEAWREPASEDELCDVVRTAARAGKRVPVVVAGHAWSPIAAPREIAVTLDALQGIVAIDHERSLATIRAGTRLARLNEELALLGLAMPILGSVAHQSIA